MSQYCLHKGRREQLYLPVSTLIGQAFLRRMLILLNAYAWVLSRSLQILSQVIREVQARRSNKFMIQLRQEPLSVYSLTQLFAAGKVGIKGGLRGHEMKSKKCLIYLQSLGRKAWLEERLKLYMSDNRIFLKIHAVWCCQQRQKLLGEEDISVGFSW